MTSSAEAGPESVGRGRGCDPIDRLVLALAHIFVHVHLLSLGSLLFDRDLLVGLNSHEFKLKFEFLSHLLEFGYLDLCGWWVIDFLLHHIMVDFSCFFCFLLETKTTSRRQCRSGAILPHYLYLLTKQIELVLHLPGKKNSCFLVFRKLIHSPNMYGRLTMELSKVKKPSTIECSSKFPFLLKAQTIPKKVFLCFSRNFLSRDKE